MVLREYRSKTIKLKNYNQKLKLLLPAAAAKSFQSCPTLCDPIDGSPPGSPVLGILQARILEWVAIPFSNAWKWKVKVKLLSHIWLLATSWTVAHQAPPSMGFSRQEYWSGVPLPSPLPGLSPTNFCQIQRKPHLLGCEYFLIFSILLIGWWQGKWESASSTLWFQLVQGLCAGGQCAVNFFHLRGVSESEKQLKNMAQNIIYSLWRRTKGPWFYLTAKQLLFCLAWLFSFVSAFSSFLWLSLFFGTEGRPRGLTIFNKQKAGWGYGGLS